MSEKGDEKKPVTFDKRSAAGSSDLLIAFIGLSIILLGCLSLFLDIPKEYSLGATLGGLFFVLADAILIGRKVGNLILLAHYVFLFLAVLSFFLLPVIISIFPKAQEKLLELNDFATMAALGIVIIILGYKALENRQKEYDEILSFVKETQEKQEEFIGKFEKMVEDLDEKIK